MLAFCLIIYTLTHLWPPRISRGQPSRSLSIGHSSLASTQMAGGWSLLLAGGLECSSQTVLHYFPLLTPDLLAYQDQICKFSRKFRVSAWIMYDTAFHYMAASNTSLPLGKMKNLPTVKRGNAPLLHFLSLLWPPHHQLFHSFPGQPVLSSLSSPRSTIYHKFNLLPNNHTYTMHHHSTGHPLSLFA